MFVGPQCNQQLFHRHWGFIVENHLDSNEYSHEATVLVLGTRHVLGYNDDVGYKINYVFLWRMLYWFYINIDL